MEVPAELAAQFKFARQKSKLAGTIAVRTSTSRTSTDPGPGLFEVSHLLPVGPVWSHLKRSLANLAKRNFGQFAALTKTRLSPDSVPPRPARRLPRHARARPHTLLQPRNAILDALQHIEPFSSFDLAGLKNVDGFRELPRLPGAGAEFAPATRLRKTRGTTDSPGRFRELQCRGDGCVSGHDLVLL